MTIQDPRLVELVARQTEQFNNNAPIEERVATLKEIQNVQELRGKNQ